MTEAARRALLARDGLRALAEWEEEYGELIRRHRTTMCAAVMLLDGVTWPGAGIGTSVHDDPSSA